MLKENVTRLLSTLEKGNNLGEPITLVCATKMVSPEIINESITYGVKVVAENKVSEFRDKHDKIVGASQHFIGHLQTNKVKYLVGKVSLIHSIDSIHLAEAVSKEATKKGVIQNVLVQINIGKEDQKGGLQPENCIKDVKTIASMPSIKVLGLMAMLPLTDDKELLKNLCLKMREFFDILKNDGLEMKYLSVGMSADYQIAIENGSNMIRLGSAIYGKRNYGGNN